MTYSELANKSTHVFYSKDKRCVIDVVNPTTGKSAINCHSMDDLRDEYPDVRMVTWAEHDQLHRESWVTPWREVTEDEWHDMLEVLPPSDWHTVNGVESFKMIEHLSGDITTIYARYNGRYWARNESYTLSPDEIADEILEHAQELIDHDS
jgi:hypothetical protein